MPINFSGSITINSISSIDSNGVLGAPNATFNAVVTTVNEIIQGTTTIFNSTISVSIYLAGNLPPNLRDLDVLPPPPPPPPPPVPLSQSTILSPDDPTAAGMPIAWSFLVPLGTLAPGQQYVIVAQDADQLAIVTQDMST